MTGSPLVKGWCPGALRPMLAGDGLIVRIRPPGGRLSAAQALEVAALAWRHGSGVIDISSRANLQLRGMRADEHEALISGLGRLDLIDADPDIEARRNILVTPFWEAGDLTQRLAHDLAQALAPAHAPRLPGKFGFAVDTGAAPVLQTAPADIRFERAIDGTLLCIPDGASTGARVTPETAVDAALSLARWFLQTGGAADGRGRMAAHIARGAALPARFAEAVRIKWGKRQPEPGPIPQGFLVGFAFGQMRAETLAGLVRSGDLRLTPWRMILVEGLREPPDIEGVIVRVGDPLSRVVACSGAPHCRHAHQPTRALARALALHVPEGSVLHVSGCAKGCAHPGEAWRTLVAQPGGFSLILDGRATDAPASGPISAEALVQRPSRLMKVH